MSSGWNEKLELIVPCFVRIHFENIEVVNDKIVFPAELHKEILRFALRISSSDIWYSNWPDEVSVEPGQVLGFD